MFRKVIVLITLLMLVLPSVVLGNTPPTVNLEADARTRATQAIALARADGHNVAITVQELESAIIAFENLALSTEDEGIGEAIAMPSASGGVAGASSDRRFSCSESVRIAGNYLSLNWWVDARVSGGRITSISRGNYNYQWNPWVPTLDFVIDRATVRGYSQNNGRKVKIRIDGQASLWLFGHVASRHPVNGYCIKGG